MDKASNICVLSKLTKYTFDIKKYLRLNCNKNHIKNDLMHREIQLVIKRK